MGAGSAYDVLSTCKDNIIDHPETSHCALFPPELGTEQDLLIPLQPWKAAAAERAVLSPLPPQEAESKSLLLPQPLQMVTVVMLPLPGDAEVISPLSIR